MTAWRAWLMAAAVAAPLPVHAQAAEPPVALEWRAPAPCPDRGAVLRRIGALLAASDTPAGVWQASAEVHGDAMSTVTARLTMQHQGQRFSRILNAASCVEAAEAVALIVALAIDPRLRVPPAAEGSAAPGAQTAGSVASAAPTPAALPLRERLPPVGLDALLPPPLPAAWREPSPGTSDEPPARVVAAALVDVGSLPALGVGPRLGAGFDRGAWSATLLVSWLPEQRQVIASEPARGGDVGLLGGGVRGCGRFRTPSWAWGACLGMGLERWSARGFGTARQETKHRWWGLGELRVEAEWRLSERWGIEIGLAALVPVHRPEFVLDHVGSVHRPGPVVGRADWGPVLHF